MIINKINKNPPIKYNMRILNYIHLIITLFIIAWLNIGVFTFIDQYINQYIKLGLVIIWILLAIITNKRFLINSFYQIWPLFLFILYILTLSIVTKNDLSAYLRFMFYISIIYLIYLYYSTKKLPKANKFICVFLLSDYIIVGIITYIELQKNPMVARFLATDSEIKVKLIGDMGFKGVGSYGYFYALVGIILLFLYLNLNFNKDRMIKYVLLIFFFMLLVKSSFATAILLCVVSSFLIILKKSLKKNVLIIPFIYIFVVAVLFSDFITYLSQLGIFSEFMKEKLLQISNFITYDGGSISQITSRMNLYNKSIEIFLDNIIFGNKANFHTISNVGGHASWLDLLGDFGIFSGLFFVFLYKVYQHLKRRINNKNHVILKFYWGYFVSLGLIKSMINTNVFIMWLLFIPIYLMTYYEID